MEIIDDLKGDLFSIAEIIGRQKALYLVSQCRSYKVKSWKGIGMVMLYIPKSKKLDLNHNLVKIVGYADAEKLVQHFGGELLHFHTKNIILKVRNAGIKTMIAQGFGQNQVAEIFNLSTRSISIIASA